MNIYVVTAFGAMIDTMCEVFNTKEDALRFIQHKWDDIKHKSDYFDFEVILDDRIWRTDDTNNQNIEWELHTKKISNSPLTN